jgi:hypothetical protein
MGKNKNNKYFEKDKKRDLKRAVKRLFKRDSIIKIVVILSTLALIVASVLPYVLL